LKWVELNFGSPICNVKSKRRTKISSGVKELNKVVIGKHFLLKGFAFKFSILREIDSPLDLLTFSTLSKIEGS